VLISFRHFSYVLEFSGYTTRTY